VVVVVVVGQLVTGVITKVFTVHHSQLSSDSKHK